MCELNAGLTSLTFPGLLSACLPGSYVQRKLLPSWLLAPRIFCVEWFLTWKILTDSYLCDQVIVSEGLSLLITMKILYLLCVSSFFPCISTVDTSFFWVIVFAMSYRGAVCVRTRGQWFHRRWDTEETVQNCLKGKCREPADLKRVSCFRSGDWPCFSKCKFYSCCCSSDQNVRSSPFSRITFVHLRCCWFCCFFPSPLFRLWWQQERNRFLLFMWIHKRKMRCCNTFQQELF